MGSKVEARERMKAAGVPIIPGTTEPVETAEDALARWRKRSAIRSRSRRRREAAGKGLKVARSPDEVERAYSSARREGEAYFADPTVYVERFLEDPRHVEVQVLADAHGNVVHLGERDCTIQRRHQKLVEETPSPAVSAELRERIGAIAVDAARAVGYRSAGTIEGLLSREGEYFFLEMNTRIQVEHPVTELVTGFDLVREQVLIAAGEPLSFRQEDVRFDGHAIECRINAEDVAAGFLPSPGTITAYREPAGPGVRVDSGVGEGSEVSGTYDPMIAKVIVHGLDRDHARRRMLRALEEYVVEGPKTLIGFHRALLSHQCFVEGETCFGLVESELLARQAEELEPAKAAGGRQRPRRDPHVARRAGRPPLRGARARPRAAVQGARPPPAGAPARPSRRPRARRRDQPDAGDGARGRGRRRGRGRSGPGHLHRRGDEDGERDQPRTATASSPTSRSRRASP